MVSLPPIEINYGKNTPTASVIWMHGLGDSGHSFIDMVPQFQLPQSLNIRFIFPNAPIRPITIFGGEKIRAWFDLLGEFGSDELLSNLDIVGIKSSQQIINALIDNEANRGVHAERVILAGFSQGAVMAMQSGFGYEKKIAGILALSGFYAEHEELGKIRIGNKSVPIFLAHGTIDQVVPFTWGKETLLYLQKLGCNVSWHEYAMEHSICPEEITEIGNWIAALSN